MNAEVRKAFDLEQQARAQLPGDTRAMVVIMSDIAQGGLNQAVIAIEEARGSLAQALEVQQQLRDGRGSSRRADGARPPVRRRPTRRRPISLGAALHSIATFA